MSCKVAKIKCRPHKYCAALSCKILVLNCLTLQKSYPIEKKYRQVGNIYKLTENIYQMSFIVHKYLQVNLQFYSNVQNLHPQASAHMHHALTHSMNCISQWRNCVVGACMGPQFLLSFLKQLRRLCQP